MTRYNVTLKNQQTGATVRTYEGINKDTIQQIIESRWNYEMNAEDILDGQSHELNSDLYIIVENESN